jgi:SAM-dependent methyltransferase
MLFSVIIGLAMIVLLVLFGLTIRSAFLGAPYFVTPKKALREIFELVRLRPGQKLYDLGAGDGKALVIANKEFGAQVLGFELSPIFWTVARLNLLIRGAKAELYCRNFYNQDLSGADVIFCFLSIHAMARLKPKFERELRPGTKIISYSFSVHGWQPKTVIRKYNGNIYLYEV